MFVLCLYLIGLLIEEITEEVGAVSSGSHRSSGTEYLAREKADPSKSEHSANGRGSSTKPEFLPDLKDDPESIRFHSHPFLNCLIDSLLLFIFPNYWLKNEAYI